MFTQHFPAAVSAFLEGIKKIPLKDLIVIEEAMRSMMVACEGIKDDFLAHQCAKDLYDILTEIGIAKAEEAAMQKETYSPTYQEEAERYADAFFVFNKEDNTDAGDPFITGAESHNVEDDLPW